MILIGNLPLPLISLEVAQIKKNTFNYPALEKCAWHNSAQRNQEVSSMYKYVCMYVFMWENPHNIDNLYNLYCHMP